MDVDRPLNHGPALETSFLIWRLCPKSLKKAGIEARNVSFLSEKPPSGKQNNGSFLRLRDRYGSSGFANLGVLGFYKPRSLWNLALSIDISESHGHFLGSNLFFPGYDISVQKQSRIATAWLFQQSKSAATTSRAGFCAHVRL